VQVHVAFTPDEEASARIGIVVDVLDMVPRLARMVGSAAEIVA
jgi:hypothetical protein